MTDTDTRNRVRIYSEAYEPGNESHEMFLAYKPCILQEDGTFSTEHGFTIPPADYFSTDCPECGKVLKKDCTCGFRAYLNPSMALAHTRWLWKSGVPAFMLSFQILGTVVFSEDWNQLRSWGAYKYGIYMPSISLGWINAYNKHFDAKLSRGHIHVLHARRVLLNSRIYPMRPPFDDTRRFSEILSAALRNYTLAFMPTIKHVVYNVNKWLDDCDLAPLMYAGKDNKYLPANLEKVYGWPKHRG